MSPGPSARQRANILHLVPGLQKLKNICFRNLNKILNYCHATALVVIYLVRQLSSSATTTDVIQWFVVWGKVFSAQGATLLSKILSQEQVFHHSFWQPKLSYGLTGLQCYISPHSEKRLCILVPLMVWWLCAEWWVCEICFTFVSHLLDWQAMHLSARHTFAIGAWHCVPVYCMSRSVGRIQWK